MEIRFVLETCSFDRAGFGDKRRGRWGSITLHFISMDYYMHTGERSQVKSFSALLSKCLHLPFPKSWMLRRMLLLVRARLLLQMSEWYPWAMVICSLSAVDMIHVLLVSFGVQEMHPCAVTLLI